MRQLVLPIFLFLFIASLAHADIIDDFNNLVFDAIKAGGDFSPYLSDSTCEGSKIFDGAKLDTAEDVPTILDANKCYATSMPKKTENGLTVSLRPAIPNQIYSDHMTSCFWVDLGENVSMAPALTKSALAFSKATNVSNIRVQLVEKTEQGVDTAKTDEMTNETIIEKSSVVSFKNVSSGREVMYCFDTALSKDKSGATILPSSNPFNMTMAGKTVDPDAGACGGGLYDANTVYTMSANVTATDVHCYDVNNINITLDCNGFTITGNNNSNKWGIFNEQPGNTFKNCNINSFGRGIYNANGAHDTIIINNNITWTANAIYLATSNTNNISNNIIKNFSSSGIQVSPSTGSRIINNTFNSTASTFATSIGGNSNNNLFVGNTISSLYWVLDVSTGTNNFNNSTSGNTYYLTNGSGAWTQYNVTVASAPGWATGGTARPFSAATTSDYWGYGSYYGRDYYPWTANTGVATPTTPTADTLTPTSPVITDTLTGGCTGSADATSYYYRFYDVTESAYRGGGFTTTNTYVLSSPSDSHDTFRVDCLGSMATGNSSTWTGTTTRTIGNTVPTNPTSLLPNGGNNFNGVTNVNINWTGSTDADGDTITYYIYYSSNSGSTYTYLNKTTSTNINMNVTAFSALTTYRVRVYANDSYGVSGNVSSAADFTITPYVSSFPIKIVTSTAFTNATTGHWFYANATANYTNGGGNLTWNSTTTSGTCVNYSNTTNGVNKTVRLNCSATAPATATVNITFINSSATANNSTSASNTFPDPNIPTLTGVAVNNSAPIITSPLSCTAGTFTDADGDTESVAARTWMWYKNGVFNGIITQATTLNATNFTVGDKISCRENSTNTTWATSLVSAISANVTINSSSSGIIGRVWVSPTSWVWAALATGNKTPTWGGSYATPWIWAVYVSGNGNKTMNQTTTGMWTWINE
jgi:hypothetical protein